ncbi:hypothetical protein [Lactobacillus equicursoris]|uniref:hypothetical protein n=1 Tax=Lactobacillus equicursoris TaxID=420645 RepID=UPI003C6CF16A
MIDKNKLTSLQYAVTQEAQTELPFSGEYDVFLNYVDVVSGELWSKNRSCLPLSRAVHALTWSKATTPTSALWSR